MFCDWTEFLSRSFPLLDWNLQVASHVPLIYHVSKVLATYHVCVVHFPEVQSLPNVSNSWHDAWCCNCRILSCYCKEVIHKSTFRSSALFPLNFSSAFCCGLQVHRYPRLQHFKRIGFDQILESMHAELQCSFAPQNDIAPDEALSSWDRARKLWLYWKSAVSRRPREDDEPAIP